MSRATILALADLWEGCIGMDDAIIMADVAAEHVEQARRMWRTWDHRFSIGEPIGVR